MGDVGVFLGVGILGTGVFGVRGHALPLVLAMCAAVLLNRLARSSRRIPLRAERRELLARLGPVASRLVHRSTPETRLDRTAPFNQWDPAAFVAEFHRLARLLPEQQALVVMLHHGLHGAERMTLEEIGALLGTSPLNVDEILHRGLSRIRHGFGEDGAGSPAWLPPPAPGPLFQAERPPPPDEGPDEDGGRRLAGARRPRLRTDPRGDGDPGRTGRGRTLPYFSSAEGPYSPGTGVSRRRRYTVSWPR
jgi:hypothetical protein